MAASLEVVDLVHGYAGQDVVRGLGFSLAPGVLGCLLGPSGCGKTTVLRCIAGFEPVRAGRVLVGGRVMSQPGSSVAPEARGIGMVFQDYALFPHLTVARNVAFGIRKLDVTQRTRRIDAMLELVGLRDAADVWPHELSGGMQQRVALARALAPEPGLLLMDEPFSNLDVDLRERLSAEVRGILKASNTTAILVTHDQNEAFALADEIGVMKEGRIEQWDSGYRLYHEPQTRFVADFIGLGVFLRGTWRGEGRVSTEFGDLAANATDFVTGSPVELLLRPDDVIHDDASPWRARVAAKAFRGAEFLYTLQLDSGTRLLSLVPSHHDHAVGEQIGFRLGVDHVVTFPLQT